MSYPKKLHLCFIAFMLISAVYGGAAFADDNAKNDKDNEWILKIQNRMQKMTPIRFEDTELSDVVQFLSQMANVNIILHPDARVLEDGSPRLVTLNVPNITLRDALRWIVRMQKDLMVEYRDGAILIDLDFREHYPCFRHKNYYVGDIINTYKDDFSSKGKEYLNSYYDIKSITEHDVDDLIDVFRSCKPDLWSQGLTPVYYKSGSVWVFNMAKVHSDIQLALNVLRRYLAMKIRFAGEISNIPLEQWLKIANAKGHRSGILNADEYKAIHELAVSENGAMLHEFSLSAKNNKRAYIDEHSKAGGSFSFDITPVILSDRKNIFAEIKYACNFTENADTAAVENQKSDELLMRTSVIIPTGSAFYFAEKTPGMHDRVRLLVVRTDILGSVPSALKISLEKDIEHVYEENADEKLIKEIKKKMMKVTPLNLEDDNDKNDSKEKKQEKKSKETKKKMPNKTPVRFADADENNIENNSEEEAEEEWIKEIKRKMQKVTPVRFEDAEFPDVIQFIAQMANVNIILSPDARNIKKDEEPRLVTLNVPNMSLQSALEWMILFQRDLAYEYRDGAIYIDLMSNIVNRIEMRFYDITDILLPVNDFYYNDILNGTDKPDKQDEYLSFRNNKIFEKIKAILSENTSASARDPNTSLSFYKGILKVEQPRYIHGVIHDMIDKMRMPEKQLVSYNASLYEVNSKTLEEVLLNSKRKDFVLSDEQLKKIQSDDNFSLSRYWTFMQMDSQRSFCCEGQYIDIEDYIDNDKNNEKAASKSKFIRKKNRNILQNKRNSVRKHIGFAFDIQSCIVRDSKKIKNINADFILHNNSSDNSRIGKSRHSMQIPDGGSIWMKIGASGSGKERKILFLVLRANIIVNAGIQGGDND